MEDGDSPTGNGKFVWPPNPGGLHPGDLNPRGVDRAVDDGASAGAQTRTVWARERPGVSLPGARGGWLCAIEDALFGSAGRGPGGEARWATGVRSGSGEMACWRCAGPVGPGEVDRAGCAWCRARRIGWGRAVSLGVYDGDLREAVQRLKYDADRGAGVGLGGALGELIGAELAGLGWDPRGVWLVPVPTTTRRRVARNRGVDHTLTLARAASEVSGCGLGRILRRSHGPSQTGVAASDRAANVRGRFSVREAWAARRVERVVLLDDVRTTGATLTACAAAIAGLVPGGVRRGSDGGVAVRWGAVGPRVLAATVCVAAPGRRKVDGVSPGAAGLAGSGGGALQEDEEVGGPPA